MASFIHSAGYAALILFGILEAACIPIPSEVTFGFAGVLAAQGRLNLVLVIVIGTLAELVGSMISYYVGQRGGRPLVRSVGKYVLVTEHDVDRAERFLEGRGAWAIPVGRMLPFVRAFTSIVAGLVRIPPLRFAVLSTIGTAIYATIITLVGYRIGKSWDSFNHKFSQATYVIVAVVVLVVVAAILMRYRQYRREQADPQARSDDDDANGASGGRGKHARASNNF